MSKKKKIIVTIVTVVVIAALITTGISVYLWQQNNKLTAQVQPVENLVWYYGGNEMTSSGMVTNDFYQDVYLIDGQTIAEVYVTEGQEVKSGDPLLAYDMTLTDLRLEMQELEVENIQNKTILARRELEKLKKETPIPEQPVIPELPPEPEPDPEPIEPEQPVQFDETARAYNFLNGETVTGIIQSGGQGTLEEPYIVRCMPGAYVEGSYLNQIASAQEPVFVKLQIIDPLSGEAVEGKFWDINTRQFNGMAFDEMAKWSVENKAPLVDAEPPMEPPMEPPVEPEIPMVPEIPQGYTAKELAEAIKNAEKNIKDLDLQRRQAELQLEQMKKVTKEGVVTATVDGTIKTVGDIQNPPQDGSPFLTVSGSEGLYVTGSLSELQLADVSVGQIVYANSWESGMSFEATIQEISPYPTENSNSWGEGNPNVSYYPYTAFISNTEGLRNGEYVDLTMTAMYTEEEASAIYLQKAYVREEDGRSYVMIADENDRLKKQYVETGKTIYGEAVEIKSGLTREDRIAFPYGKTAKEGVKVDDSSGGGGMRYY